MKLGVKSKKALSIAKKGVVIAGAVGAIAGLGHKAENKFDDVKAEVESEIDKKKDEAQAAQAVAGAVANIGVAGVKEAAANPLKAKKALEKSKKMAVGVAAAGKVDLQGAAAQAKFAAAPKTTGTVNIKGAVAYAQGSKTAKIADGGSKGGFSSAGGGGDIRVCDKKYGGKLQKNDKRKCRKRVKAGGMP